MTTLSVNRLTLYAPRALPPRPVIRDVSFAVPAGTITALFGRSTAEARAVLRSIAGLEPEAEGGVRLDDAVLDRLPVHRRGIGLVQRDTALFPGSVRDNVLFGLRQQKWPKQDRDRRVAEVLELVGLTGSEADRVDGLAEGQRARIALARAVAPRPAALLLESPAWYVPAVDRVEFRARLRAVLQSLDIPVVITTGDVQDAVGLADDLHVLHEGEVLQSGSVSRVLAGPSSIEAAELLGYVTLIRGEVSNGWIVEPDAGAVRFPEGFPLSGTARALAHPTAMLGVPDASGVGCGVAGQIERIRATGPTHLLDVRIADRVVEVRWEWDLAPPPMDELIGIAVTPGTMRFFNERAAAPQGTRPPARDAVGSVEDDDGDGADDDGETEEMIPPPADGDSIAEDDEDEPRAGAGPLDLEADGAGLSDEVSASANLDEPGAGDERFEDRSSSPPAPALAPPRSQSPAPDGGAESSADRPAGLFAPWLQVSRRPGREPERPPEDLHRGMPLD